jgi:hypothetical protein
VGCFPCWGYGRCRCSSHISQRWCVCVRINVTGCPFWCYCRQGNPCASWPRCRCGNTTRCCGGDNMTIWCAWWFLGRWWSKSSWLACAPHTWLRSNQPWWTGATGCCGCRCCNGMAKLTFLTINNQYRYRNNTKIKNLILPWQEILTIHSKITR